jgi:hypothetical protein
VNERRLEFALNTGLARRQRIAECVPAKVAGDGSKDFTEVLRHELNNPLTGNVQLLLAQMARKKDGRLPHGALKRVEMIPARAVRMGETVRQLSHKRETIR